jgi:hypothetical protein
MSRALRRIDEGADDEPNHAGEGELAGCVEPTLFVLGREIEAALSGDAEFLGPIGVGSEHAPIGLRIEPVLGADDAILVERDAARQDAIVENHVTAASVRFGLD